MLIWSEDKEYEIDVTGLSETARVRLGEYLIDAGRCLISGNPEVQQDLEKMRKRRAG